MKLRESGRGETDPGQKCTPDGMRVKVAFRMLGSDTWQGGFVYLSKLLQALRTVYGDKLTLCVLTSNEGQNIPDELRRLADEVVVSPPFKRGTACWLIESAAARLMGGSLLEGRFLKRQGIKVVAFGQAPRTCGIQSLGWLADFQHVHFPEMFSSSERLISDRGCLDVAERSDRVVLLSEAVRRDFEAFSPRHAHKARVVNPITCVPPSVYEAEPKSVSDKYALPERFIYLPGQFWRHKNHTAAFQTLRILNGRGLKLFLVCSGNPVDYRHPTYFAELLGDLSRWGVRDQVALLGLIPRDHVLALMRQSVCVLNPSLFEGYGMTVEEARSIGKQVLLSDIPAHREQSPPRAVFFNPKDCDELATALGRVWRENSPGPDTALETEARQSLPGRLRNCAQSFMSVVWEVLKR